MVYVDEVLKIEGVNYHLTGAGEDEGGTVSFGYLNESSEWVDAAPAADSEIAFIRQVAYTQTASLPSHSPFASETIEQALDRIVMMCQQLARIILWSAPIETLPQLSADPDTSGWASEHLGYTWINTTDGHKKMWNGTEVVIDA